MKKTLCFNQVKIWNNLRNIAFVFIFIFVGSCKKNTAPDYNEDPDSLQKVFIQFWHRMNNQYVYWDKEQTDWDSIYREYKPLFDKLTDSDIDRKKAASYFKQMSGNLIDNHFNITFNEGVLRNLSINPSYDRKIKSENFRERFNYENIVKPYLDAGFLSGKGNITEFGVPISVTSGTINKNVLYFHCSFFALKQSYDSDRGIVREALTYFFSQLNGDVTPIRGIILDLRNNSGGNVLDLNFFAGKLIKQDITFGYTRSKSGLGKLNYLPWLESKLKHDPDYHVNVPVILLADNFSASLAEIMMIALRSKENVVIGERTYGATGVISNPEIFNSGSFRVGDFLTVKTAAVEFKGRDGTFYENVGITPDIYSPFNLKDLAIGRDTQLELAIRQFQNER